MPEDRRVAATTAESGRDLHWDGCVNVRDLGGLATVDGRVTRFRSVVRADNPANLTEPGWRSMREYGVRTVVTLRTEGTVDEEPEPTMVPPGIVIERVLIEDANDVAFRNMCIDTQRWLTPLYFGDMVRHWPERCVAVAQAVARAAPGGIVISCGVGRDRTGLVTFLLLALAGVRPDVVAADWQISVERLADCDPDHAVTLAQLMTTVATTVEDEIAQLLATADIERRLIDAGLSVGDLSRVRARLLD